MKVPASSLLAIPFLFMISSMPFANAQGSAAAPELTAPMPGYCLKKVKQAAFDIKQKRASGFFRIKTGVFCTTPMVTTAGNFITGCDDGQIRFVSNKGIPTLAIKFDHDADSGMSSNPEITAIPNTSPQEFVATSQVDQEVIRFDLTGKIITKTILEAGIGKPAALSNSTYFAADVDGVGHYFVNGNEVLIDTKSSYLNEPSPRVSSLGENQIVISDDHGNVFILNQAGEMKTINVSKAQLSNTKIAPDGRVWVSDSAGIMYVINVETQEVKTINMGKGKIFARPLFLKNGKIVFGGGDYIFIFDGQNLDQPEAIYDYKINAEIYSSGKTTHYLGSLMENSELAALELEDGNEYIFVPTHGGYHLINTQGNVAAIFEYGAGLGDAETFSSPVKLNDGSFAIGAFYGFDRVAIQKSAVNQIPTGSWVPCN